MQTTLYRPCHPAVVLESNCCTIPAAKKLPVTTAVTTTYMLLPSFKSKTLLNSRFSILDEHRVSSLQHNSLHPVHVFWICFSDNLFLQSYRIQISRTHLKRLCELSHRRLAVTLEIELDGLCITVFSYFCSADSLQFIFSAKSF